MTSCSPPCTPRSTPAGSPRRPPGVELTPPKDSGHGDFTTNVALQLAKPLGSAAARRRRQAGRGARARAAGAPGTGRDRRSRASSTSTSRPTGCTRCCARSWPTGETLRPRPCARRASASTSSSCRPTPPGRSTPAAARWVAVGDALANLLAAAGRRSCTASTTSTTPATSSTPSRRRSSRATEGRKPPEDGYQGAVRDRHGRSGCAPSWATTVTEDAGRASGATATRCAACRTTSAASACTSTPGSPSARSTRRATVARALDDLRARGVGRRARRRDLAARHRLRRPARPRAGEVRRLHHLPLQRHRLPPRQVRARLGAPHRHLGRRPPRPGEVAAGRAWRRSATPRASPRCCSASW